MKTASRLETRGVLILFHGSFRKRSDENKLSSGGLLIRPVFTFLLVLCALTVAKARPALMNTFSCESAVSRQVIASKPEGRTIVWTFQDRHRAEVNAPVNEPLIRKHQAWIRRNTPLNSRQILAQSISVRQRALENISPRDPFRETLLRDIRNISRVLNGEIGRLREMRCGEALPFREYLQIANLESHPQEFVAVFLGRNDQLKVLADLYRHPRGSVVGVRFSQTLVTELRRLNQQGWRAEAHLHNHPFHFENPYGDVGGNLVPSDPDLSLYRQGAYRRLIILNGLQSFEMDRSQLGLFE